MIASACCISAALGMVCLGATAVSDTVVPLVRSSPRLTLKSLCAQLAGWKALLPTISRKSTTISAPSTASARPGRETLPLAGATSRLSFDSHAVGPGGERHCPGDNSVVYPSSEPLSAALVPSLGGGGSLMTVPSSSGTTRSEEHTSE